MFQAPLLGECGIEEGDAENAEEHTVDHAGDSDGVFDTEDAFRLDRVVKEVEVGDGLDDADDAKASDGVIEHGWRGSAG